MQKNLTQFVSDPDYPVHKSLYIILIDHSSARAKKSTPTWFATKSSTIRPRPTASSAHTNAAYHPRIAALLHWQLL